MTMETPVIDGYSLWNRPAIGVAPWKLSAKLTEFHHCSAPQSCPTACRHSLVLKRMTSWVVWLNCSSLFRFNHLWPTDVHICSNMFIYVQICSYMFTYMSIFSIVERLYETVWRIALVNSPPWDHHQSVHLEDRASSAPWISWIVMIQTDQIDQIPQNTTGLFLHSKDTPKKKDQKWPGIHKIYSSQSWKTHEILTEKGPARSVVVLNAEGLGCHIATSLEIIPVDSGVDVPIGSRGSVGSIDKL